MKKLNILQVYRGFAAILVVLYHVTVYGQEKLNYAFLGSFFSFGFIGVDFFFVLSGFIIFYAHGNELGQHKALPRYLDRRFKRIYPFYWIVTSFKILAVFIVPLYAKSYEKDPSVIAKSLALFPQENLPLIGAAWTLSHEVLFYVIFGFMIFFGGRWALGLLSAWCVSIVALSAIQLTGLSQQAPDYLITFILNPRNLEFIFGCLSGYLVTRYRIKGPTVLALVGAVWFVLGGIYLDVSGVNSAMMFVLLFGLSSFLIVTGSASLEKHNAVKLPRVLVLLGDASYSIYLGAFAFVNVLTLGLSRLSLISFLGPFFTTLIVALLAVAGGTCVYILVERPLLRFLRGRRVIPVKTAVATEGTAD